MSMMEGGWFLPLIKSIKLSASRLISNSSGSHAEWKEERGTVSMPNNKNNKKRESKHYLVDSQAGFTHQNIELSNNPLFFPPGYESIFLVLYIVFLPYLTGLLFLFLYVAQGDINVFNSLSSESSFLFSWCIGYECLAVLALLMIVKNAILFSSKSMKRKNKRSIQL
ncbi:MAG: hypothetical protein ABXS92_00895 [Sulfurimonas sp.]